MGRERGDAAGGPRRSARHQSTASADPPPPQANFVTHSGHGVHHAPECSSHTSLAPNATSTPHNAHRYPAARRGVRRAANAAATATQNAASNAL